MSKRFKGRLLAFAAATITIGILPRTSAAQTKPTGGILPVHSLGVSMTGAIPSGAIGLRWVAEIANGRAARDPGEVPVQNFVDENNGKAVNVRSLCPSSVDARSSDGSLSLLRSPAPGWAYGI